MSVGTRLREERQRLGFSQERLANVAGVAKNTAINWEKDASSPTAAALIAFGEAGADVPYILTGRRLSDPAFAEAGTDLLQFLTGPRGPVTVDDRIAAIRDSLFDPIGHVLPGESPEAAEKRILSQAPRALKVIQLLEGKSLTPDQAAELEHLLDIAENPAALTLNRAAHVARVRGRRRAVTDELSTWFQGGSYQPNSAVINLLALVMLDYRVPAQVLVELVQEVSEDVNNKRGMSLG